MLAHENIRHLEYTIGPQIRGAWGQAIRALLVPAAISFIIAPTAALWAVAPALATGWRRIVFGCLVSGLTVLAASLLTQMRLGYLAAIERLEAGKGAM